MVTRARIIKVLSEHCVKIEVPAFGLIEELEGESQVNELPDARICTVPGCSPNFKEGEIVLICIEDNDLNDAMIMGRLIPDDNTLGTSNAIFQTLKVEKDTTLSRTTTIGEVTADNIEQLIGVNYNIQAQFDTDLAQKIDLLNLISETLDKVTFE